MTFPLLKTRRHTKQDRHLVRPNLQHRPNPNTTLQGQLLIFRHSCCYVQRVGEKLTVLWSSLEVHLVELRLDEQSIVRAEPRSILRVGMRIVGETADTLVPSDSGQVPSFGMDDIVDLLVLCCQLEDSTQDFVKRT